MGWYPCSDCCLPECASFTDDFDNPAGSTLDSNWDERSGAWEYLGPGLQENSGGAGGIAICQVETATEEQSIVITGPRDEADVVSVICNYLDDNNYFFVEMEGNVSTEIRLYRRASGSNQLLHTGTIDPPVPSDPGGMTVCFSYTSFTVTAGEGVVYVCIDDYHVGGKKAGLRNGGTSTIDFDDFTLENYAGSDGNFDGPTCCLKQCECRSGAEVYCIPNTLTLTFVATGLGNACGALDGLSFPLTWQPMVQRWQSTGHQPPGALGGDITWILECNASLCPPLSQGYIFKLSSYSGVVCSTPGAPSEDDCLALDSGNDSYTCNPLIVSFIGQSFVGIDPPDPGECFYCVQTAPGWWNVVITE